MIELIIGAAALFFLSKKKTSPTTTTTPTATTTSAQLTPAQKQRLKFARFGPVNKTAERRDNLDLYSPANNSTGQNIVVNTGNTGNTGTTQGTGVNTGGQNNRPANMY